MTYAAEVLADSPLVYLKLDETSGTALADASGNSHGFTLNGGTLNQATVMPSGVASINLNSTAQNAQATASAWMNTTSFTVEAWIKLTNVTSYHAIASRESNTSLGWTCYVKDGKLNFLNAAVGDNLGSTTLSTGTAYHAVFTYDSASSTAKVYLNGALDGTFTSVSISNAAFDMFLGASRAGTVGSLFFSLTGNLDEFAYYGGALSSMRIAAHYAARTGASTVSGTAAAALGGVTAAATGVRTVHGTAAAALGGVAASAAGVRTDHGTAAAAIGGVTAAAAGTRTDVGAGVAALGGVTATATASAPQKNGTAAATFGSITATATGTRTDHGTASALLGALLASAAGTRSDVAAASAALGAVTAAATGMRGRSGVALADLGALIAAAVGTVTGVIVAPAAGPFRWGFTMLAPSKALIPIEQGLDYVEWGFVMLQPGDALIGDPA